MQDLDLSADIIDVRDIIERVETLEGQQVPRFVAGSNVAGYLLESEPAEFDNFEDAQSYIIALLKSDEDVAETESKAEDLSAAAEDVNLESDEFSITVAGVEYWVKQDGQTGLDAEDAAELANLREILSDLEGMGGDEQFEGAWYPVTLIAEGYFTEYTRELLEDCGDLPRDLPHYIEIDWDSTARNIKVDYSAVEISGSTYYTR